MSVLSYSEIDLVPRVNLNEVHFEKIYLFESYFNLNYTIDLSQQVLVE